MTTREWLEAWDRGECVASVEMGGIGPGYEQAIQRLVVEIIRDNDCVCPEWLKDEVENDKRSERSKTWGDDTARRLDKEPWAGFSGAQVGAARNLAYRILRDGPDGVLESLRKQGIEDRLIIVSKAAI